MRPHLSAATHDSGLGAWRQHPARRADRQVLSLLQLDGLRQDEVLLSRAVAQLRARQGHGHLERTHVMFTANLNLTLGIVELYIIE